MAEPSIIVPGNASVFLFKPGKKDLRREYPELADVPEFAEDAISHKEMDFVWYWSNETSPYYDVANITSKISKCYDAAFVEGDVMADGSSWTKSQFPTGNFPPKIKRAIDKMRLYNPDARLKALAMAVETFKNFQRIVAQNLFENDVSEETLREQKTYVDMAQKINESLPELIRIIESGFGLKIVTESGKDIDYFTLGMTYKK